VLDGRHRQKRRHDFAFSGLTSCGECGRAMVGELKKGRYVYYHCPCASPYIREELLEAEFTKAIRRLVFTPEFLMDAKLWLQQANAEDIQEREQTMVRLQAELDGVIDEAFFRRKTDECRAEIGWPRRSNGTRRPGRATWTTWPS
jgi:hypothetical protein